MHNYNYTERERTTLEILLSLTPCSVQSGRQRVILSETPVGLRDWGGGVNTPLCPPSDVYIIRQDERDSCDVIH
jgi:hypothetical protein